MVEIKKEPQSGSEVLIYLALAGAI